MGIPVSHVRHTETNRTMPHASFASRYINRSDNMCTECTALTCLLCKRIATPAAFVDRVDENSVSPDVRAVVPQDLLFSLNNTISQLQCSSSPSISAIFTFEFKRFFFYKNMENWLVLPENCWCGWNFLSWTRTAHWRAPQEAVRAAAPASLLLLLPLASASTLLL